MGRYVAGVIEAELRGQRHGAGGTHGFARKPFAYRDKGSMATIGRSAAVAEIGKIRLSGFIAWAAWLTVHLLFLIGFRNRFSVLMEWLYSYFTFKSGARIITGGPGETPPTGVQAVAPNEAHEQESATEIRPAEIH
jgi:NADH dehydrogenase